MNINWKVITKESTCWQYEVDGLVCRIEYCGAFNPSIELANVGFHARTGMGLFDHSWYSFRMSMTGFRTLESAQKWVEANIQFAIINIAPLKKAIEAR